MKERVWKKAEIVSLAGLKPRARGKYCIGQVVEAYIERERYEEKEDVAVLHGLGIAGTDVIVPVTMIKFVE